MELDNKSLNRQLDEMKSQTIERKKIEATARSEQQKVEDLQRKLKTETDNVTKFRKTQQDHKKVRENSS